MSSAIGVNLERWNCMRCHTTAIVSLLLVGAVARQAPAAAFSNLDFESSTLLGGGPPQPPTPVATSLLFPSWTFKINDMVWDTGYLNEYPLAGALSALTTRAGLSQNVIDGSRTLYLQAWVNTSVSMLQNGDVPVGTQSLRFSSRNVAYSGSELPPGPLFLHMNGQDVPLVTLLSSGTGDFVFGADVSFWAGTTAGLELGVLRFDSPSVTGFALIDAISFSPEPIPDPTSLSLLALGGLLLRRRRGR